MPAHVRLRHGPGSAGAKAHQTFLDACKLTQKEVDAVNGLTIDTGEKSQKRASGESGRSPSGIIRRRGGVVAPGIGHLPSGMVGGCADHNTVPAAHRSSEWIS